jgi:S-adenosylmethionine-diacylglycerol 3-amino-3-carboxypropyl transferase
MQLLTDEPRQHDKINFSDVFEYLSPQQTTEALAVAATALKPGGRICYWNLLVERQCPPELSDRIRQLRDLGDTLWKRDRSWFYRAVRVEEVIA